MNPSKVDRNSTKKLTDLPNVGKAVAADLNALGIKVPSDLIGRDPYDLYVQLCAVTGHRHDPCMIDVFISITRFVNGEEPRPWWDFTAERKKLLRTE